MGVHDRQRQRYHRERDPTRANGEPQAFALAVCQRRLGEFLDVLLNVGSPIRPVTGMGENASISQYAQMPAPSTWEIGSRNGP